MFLRNLWFFVFVLITKEVMFVFYGKSCKNKPQESQAVFEKIIFFIKQSKFFD
jgi:hypothetical protein